MAGIPTQFLHGPQPWVFPYTCCGGVDFDLAHLRGAINGRLVSLLDNLTCSRASTAYAADGNGNYISFANNVPRLTSGVGLTVEESRTNSIRNNFMTGAVVGVARTVVPITSLSRTASATAVAAAAGTNVAVGDLVTISGASVSAYNGTFVVSAAVASTSFSYVTANSTTDSASGASYTAISAGTLPTNWGTSNSSGLSPAVIAIGTVQGINYIDLQIAGVGTGITNLNIEGTTQIAALQNQVWTQSSFLGLTSGSLTNISYMTLTISERNSGGGGLLSDSSVVTPTSALARYGNTQTLSNASTAYVLPQIVVTEAGAVNITLRIGWPQLELGSFTTSPIVTTNAAVTRAADVVTMTRPPKFGASYSLFAQGTPQALNGYATAQIILSADDGTTTNRTQIYRNASTASFIYFEAPNGANIANGTWNQNISGKIAVAIAASDEQLCQNGTLPAGQSVAGVNNASLTRVGIGVRGDNSTFFNGTISRIAIWPTMRIPNAMLQNITT